MTKASNDDWIAGVFEDLAILMVDEKTSVRKEALVCLQHMIAQFDTYFQLSASSDLQQAVEIQSLAELRSKLKQEVQIEYDAFKSAEPLDNTKFMD